jgi:transcriptional regulator with XRE-family HTH domain
MTLDAWRTAHKLSFAALAQKLGRSRAHAFRLCRKGQLPDRADMARIQTLTEGAVTPNDFYAVSETNAAPLPEPVTANG